MKRFLVYLGTLVLALSLNATGLAEDGKALAKKMVTEAIAFTKVNGRHKVIDAINLDKKFMQGDIYVTIFDMKGTVLAHPTKPARVGNNLISDIDADGALYIAARVKIAEKIVQGGAKEEDHWQTYKFENPISKKIEGKTAYVEVYDGMIFGAGAYKK